MVVKVAAALGCVLALVAVPAANAEAPARAPYEKKPAEACRLLPPSAQPRAPRAARRATTGSITVVIPRTTCNEGR